MTFLPWRENIVEDCWQRLGPSKYALGRRRIRRLVERAIREWPQAELYDSAAGSLDEVSEKFSCRIGSQEFGSVLVIVFAGLVSALVRVLLEWWLMSDAHRVEFRYWQRELRS